MVDATRSSIDDELDRNLNRARRRQGQAGSLKSWLLNRNRGGKPEYLVEVPCMGEFIPSIEDGVLIGGGIIVVQSNSLAT